MSNPESIISNHNPHQESEKSPSIDFSSVMGSAKFDSSRLTHLPVDKGISPENHLPDLIISPPPGRVFIDHVTYGTPEKAEKDLRKKSDDAELSKHERDATEALQHDLLTGNLTDLAKHLKDLPATEREKVLAELNKELRDTNSGLSLEQAGKDHVAIYGRNQSKAVDVDLTTGEGKVEAVQRLQDGTTVLYGQVMDANAGDVFKDLSHQASSNICQHEFLDELSTEILPYPGPVVGHHTRPWPPKVY